MDSKTKVLVVDDEIATLELLKMLLEIMEFEAVTTLNSVDAMTLAEIEKPDVALLDIMMPELDGFQLCKMMRQHPATKNLPIIFVTAYSALDLEERRREVGADYVLHKPIDMDQLTHAIEQTQEIRRAANVVADAVTQAQSVSNQPESVAASASESISQQEPASPQEAKKTSQPASAVAAATKQSIPSDQTKAAEEVLHGAAKSESEKPKTPPPAPTDKQKDKPGQ